MVEKLISVREIVIYDKIDKIQYNEMLLLKITWC